MGADKIQFYLLDITYKIKDSKAAIYLFGRTLDNKQITVIDESFQPYFYVFLKDEASIIPFQDKVKKIKVEQKDREAEVTDTEITTKNT